MKYASYLYSLLYPYLMLLSQYPIHTAYKNMMQTYDFTEYYLVFCSIFLLTGISVFLLYHCYQAIQPRIRYGIELVNLILLGSYVYSFFSGNQLLPVFSILLVSDFARGFTMVCTPALLSVILSKAPFQKFILFHSIIIRYPQRIPFSTCRFLVQFFHIIATKNVTHFLFPLFPI